MANFSIQDLQKRNNLSISKEDRRKSLVRCLFDFKKTIIRSAKRWLFRSTRSYFHACKVAEESISEGCTLGKICQWIQPRNSVNFPALGSGSGNNRNLFCPSTLAFFTIFLSSRHFSSRLPLHHFNHPSSFSFFFFLFHPVPPLYLLLSYVSSVQRSRYFSNNAQWRGAARFSIKFIIFIQFVIIYLLGFIALCVTYRNVTKNKNIPFIKTRSNSLIPVESGLSSGTLKHAW